VDSDLFRRIERQGFRDRAVLSWAGAAGDEFSTPTAATSLVRLQAIFIALCRRILGFFDSVDISEV
jgi:hypothetical protein